MKSSPIFPFAKRCRGGGFTLVEILVAVVLLVFLVLMLAQIFGMINGAWIYGRGKINNFTKGRAMLNVMENDLRAAVFRPDLAAFPGGAFSFYTERPGVSTGGVATSLRNISLVQYALTTGTVNGFPTSTLERSDMPIAWTDAATYLAFGNPTGFLSSAPAATTGTITPRDTAPGVIAFQIVFVQADGSFSTSVFTPALSIAGKANANPTRSIGVTIAVVNDQSMMLLRPSQVTSLQSGLMSALSSQGSPSVKAVWEKYLNSNLVWSSYPKNLSVGIYECYVSLP